MQNNPQIILHQLTFTLPDGKAIFNNLSLALGQGKTGLVGKNGIGKSTLIKLIMGELQPDHGVIHTEAKLAYVPQNPGFDPNVTIIEFLGYGEKIHALSRIKHGSVDERDYEILDEDWHVEERVQQQLVAFGLNTLPYHHSLSLLSGGEMTRLMLTKAFFSGADLLLLDEPTNHLDCTARKQLYEMIQKWEGGLLVISHDRTLLNLMDEIIELTLLGLNRYGGNYEAYQQQKYLEITAKQQQLFDAKKTMIKTQRSVQNSKEKHEQRQAQGQQLRRSGSQSKLILDAMKERSTRSQGEFNIRSEKMLKEAENKLQQAKETVEITEEINVELPATSVPKGKMILDIENISYTYPNTNKHIIQNFNLKIQGPERVAMAGPNGSGKTTLIELILDELQPQQGKIYVGTKYVSYLDQNTGLLNPDLSLLENFLNLNPDAKENDAYRALASFLFKNVTALKLVKNLSGGETLRALLACVLLSQHPPQLLILDEPTNHLDLQSIESIESALKNYQGAMIVISHDQQFLENIGIKRIIHAPFLF